MNSFEIITFIIIIFIIVFMWSMSYNEGKKAGYDEGYKKSIEDITNKCKELRGDIDNE